MLRQFHLFKTETIGNATLYLGNCLEIMRGLGAVDAMITDPPYGVEFTGKVTKHTNNSGSDSYLDTEENFRGTVLPAVSLGIERAKRSAIFTGTRRLDEYPKARDIGGITCPNGGGRSSWGFGCHHPVLFYGTSPYMQAGKGARPTATVMYHPGMHVTGEDMIDHPCPKPIAFMLWLVELASLEGETVLDPFMGSGTTGVACLRLGRKFVGIEIEPRYFDVARARIEDALRQPDLFINRDKPEQFRFEMS